MRFRLSRCASVGLVSIAASVCAVTAVDAAVMAWLWEDGDDVRAEYSGSLDISGLTPLALNLFPATSLDASSGSFQNLPGVPFGSYDQYLRYLDTPVPSFGNGRTKLTNSGVFGNPFAAFSSGGSVILDQGYTSGDKIYGGFSFQDTDLADLGALIGTYRYTRNGEDAIILNVGTSPAPVPLPAGLPLLLTSLGVFTFVRLLRRFCTD